MFTNLIQGVRELTISSNLTEEQQRAVIQAITDWHNDDSSKNGTIDLTFSQTTAICDDLVNASIWGNSNSYYGALALREIYMPEATSAGEGAFSMCYYVESIRLPKLETAGDMCFSSIGFLLDGYAVVELPVLKNVFANSFTFSKIQTLILPEVTNIPSNFITSNNFYIETIVLPKVTTLEENAFIAGTALKHISFGSIITKMVNIFFDPRNTNNAAGCDLILKKGQTNFDREGNSTGNPVLEGLNQEFGGYYFNSITLVE